MARAFAMVVLVSLALASGGARAQDPMAAEVLFNEGVKLMQAGDFAAACSKIAESRRLEPRPGTLFTLAECWARAGRTATALARYHEYLRVFKRMSAAQQEAQRGRDAVAGKQVAELEPIVPRLKVELLAPVPEGTVVKRNGAVLGQASLGLWLPLDPGVHEIVAQALGGLPTVRRIELAAGQREEVKLQVAPPLPAQPLLVPSVPTPVPPPPAAQDSPGLSRLSIGALVLGAVAVVGIAAGTATGIMALQRKSDVDAECGVLDDPAACTAAGKAHADAAQSLAAASTASFVIGLASGGAAVTLLLLDGSSTPSGPDPTGTSAAAWLSYTAHW